MNPNDYCVIMAGGVGTRFWPMSREGHPKQFIDFLGTGQTLIQQTFQRFKPICLIENIFVVTNEKYFSLVREQIPELPPENILCEPSGRNTAPCIAFASYRIANSNPSANIVVAPSDHIIQNEARFHEVIATALRTVREHNWLLTLGIQPSRPDTGYGYIQFIDEIIPGVDSRIKKVKTFTEKPNHELARAFLASGDFLWNAGIFIWNLQTILHALEAYLPDIFSLFNEGKELFNTPDEKAFIEHVYTHCKSISIDYGVMEKADNVYTLMSDFGWSDLGTWASLYEIRQKDPNSNSIIGNQVMAYDTHNCIVHVPHEKIVVLQGLDNLIVVEDEGMLLICNKNDEQQIRSIVNDLKIRKK
ncbi:MAG TPA: mannose-1-phosphate guanylyltransferase [Bacteroidales bacterium]|nr:mannose-1-phosphate guanylyltransferase [Bacteroidales bacterium]